MELNNQNNYQEQHYQNDDYVNSGGLSLKVMTDEQMETLRKQISVYAILCEQLVDLHRSFSAQEYITSGVGMGSLYSDSMMTYGGVNKMTRHRWTPTPVQLQMLERMFKEGIGTPSKQKIKDLTAELSQHGPISESNVYNWFQNRRARSKRKQVADASNHSDADVEPETDQLSSERNTRPPDASNVQDNTPPGAMNGYIQDPAGSHCLGTQRSKGKSSFSSGHDMRSYGTYRQLAIYETAPRSR